MKRLDLALVELGLAPTRAKAQQLIQAGEVEVREKGTSAWKIASRPSQQVEVSAECLRLIEGAESLKYVSRAGLKLEGALDQLQLDVEGWRCLDLGLSTGGFADCLLRRGAHSICGIDVGHGQVHERLKSEPKLQIFEGVHIKDATDRPEIQQWLRDGVDLVVADLSFISLISLFPLIAGFTPKGGRLLALIKPQFEVGAANLDKKGVVRDDRLFGTLKERVLHALDKCGFSVEGYFLSRMKGQDGNQEFFVFANRT